MSTRIRSFLLALVATLVVLGATASASAQEKTFTLDRASVSGAWDDGFMVWRPYMHQKSRYYGTAALGYAHNPLRRENVTESAKAKQDIEAPLRFQLHTYLTFGVELANRLGINLQLPVIVYQSGGADPQFAGVGSGLERNPVVLGDARLDGRLKFYESDSGFLKLGAGGAFFLPTGGNLSFGGDDQVGGYLFGAAEMDFDGFFLAGNVGPWFRPQRGILGDNASLDLASELRYSAGAYIPLRDNKIRLGAEIWGTTGIEKAPDGGEQTFFKGNNTTVEWNGQIRFNLGKKQRSFFQAGGGTRLTAGYGAADFRILAMVGIYDTWGKVTPRQTRRGGTVAVTADRDSDNDGFPDDIDMCPTVPEDKEAPDPSDGCPGDPDSDKDGIPDSADDCPEDPEDKDRIQDHDGCPEDDADKDGILDKEDKCPTDVGMPNKKDPEKHGCPVDTKVDEGSGQIILLKPIQFATGRATIKAVSFPILDEVVLLLKTRKELKIAVHGHTDNRGRAAMNQRLSENRAAACVKYLVTKGIDENRLQSQGFGPDKPLDTNDTANGRARNRRVEFKIVGKSGEDTDDEDEDDDD